MGLIHDLGSSAVALDTPLFIYLIEEHPKYLPIVRPVFAGLDAGTINGVTSTLTLLEVLVRPYRVGNAPLAAQYESLLTRSRGLRLAEITRATCQAAAQLRAAYGVKTPDALQLATALLSNSSVFLTNDRALPTVAGIHVLQVLDYLS